MLLAVDVGNTQTVIGLFDGDMLACHFRIATVHETTADELRIHLIALMAAEGLSLDRIDGVALASVVPELTTLWREVASRLRVEPLVVGVGIETGLSIRYEHPAEIGADRIADAVAAIELYDAPVVVVDLGTATNIEVIDRDGAFIGGIIAPGLETSADALFNAAARLSRLDLVAPERVIGSSTRSAVQSGLIYGEVARIDGLIEMVCYELGYDPTIVATGGLAPRIAPISSRISQVDVDLTLTGLRLLYTRNR